ncbi:hypothetical protein V5O48_002429 [Marasmius crinis-equi]|uniref:Uncharacterized protein n=1 Tax=Marasmius crinis-equi TaxID=585013 RepID=A0ABR3FW96_9AGAR
MVCINTALFFICLWVLLYSKQARGGKINKPFLVAAIVIYTLCTAHMITDFARAIVAFINYADRPGGPRAFYDQLWVWSCILRVAIFSTNSLVVDALLIYRLYVVWGHNVKLIIGPIMIWIGSAACEYRTVWGFSDISVGQDTYAEQVYSWAIISFGSSGIELGSCFIVAGRIWWLRRKMSRTLGVRHGLKYSRAMAVFLESAAMYVVCLLIIVLMYATKSNGVYIVFDSTAQIMGIAPTLIIVRVGLGLSSHERNVVTTTTTPTGASHSTAVRFQYHSATDTDVSAQVRKAVEMEIMDSGAPDYGKSRTRPSEEDGGV